MERVKTWQRYVPRCKDLDLGTLFGHMGEGPLSSGLQRQLPQNKTLENRSPLKLIPLKESPQHRDT
jgi:hypothetical protein